MLQEFIGRFQFTGAHPVGAQLDLALHPHEALVLCVQEKRIRKYTWDLFEMGYTTVYFFLPS